MRAAAARHDDDASCRPRQRTRSRRSTRSLQFELGGKPARRRWRRDLPLQLQSTAPGERVAAAAPTRRPLMRQYELVERVKGYDPSADEELLNRAYVFAMQAHGAQLRASGDPYFSHPVEVAGILAALEAGQRLDRDRPAARHGRGHRRDHRRARAAVRRRGRPPGRRRHQAQQARSAVLAHRAGREFPQAAARDVRGHPRAAGQARRPAAQHAHAAFHLAMPTSASGSRARRSRSTRRSPSGSACRRSRTSSRTWRSRRCGRMRASRCATACGELRQPRQQPDRAHRRASCARRCTTPASRPRSTAARRRRSRSGAR